MQPIFPRFGSSKRRQMSLTMWRGADVDATIQAAVDCCCFGRDGHGRTGNYAESGASSKTVDAAGRSGGDRCANYFARRGGGGRGGGGGGGGRRIGSHRNATADGITSSFVIDATRHP